MRPNKFNTFLDTRILPTQREKFLSRKILHRVSKKKLFEKNKKTIISRSKIQLIWLSQCAKKYGQMDMPTHGISKKGKKRKSLVNYCLQVYIDQYKCSVL